ncbi:MAG: hypothetical protein AAF624_14260 [Bacteroidota bacterium]
MPRPSTTPTTPDERLRAELVAVLRGGHAHVATAQALAGVPLDRINDRIDSGAHSLWDLLEHLRLGRVDIDRVRCSRDAVCVSERRTRSAIP